MKKFLSLLLALTMLLALGTTTAFAANNDGSITISNATTDTEYSVYKVFDLTYSGDNVSYSYTKNGDSDAFFTALQGADSPFTLTETVNSGVYSVALKDGKDAAAISLFLAGDDDHPGQIENLTAVKSATATGDTLKFEGLDYGYYFVTSGLGATITIDSTMKDVTVVDKNQKPTWDNGGDKPGKVIVLADGSKVTENSVNYGDTVNFSVAINATHYVGNEEVTYYYITDTLADGFSKAENIVVKVNGNELTAADYTLAQNGNTFQVTVPYKEAYGANSVIEVTYSATVLNTALLAGNGNLNKANFTYGTKTPGGNTPDPDPDPEYPSDREKTTTTYVYALGIVKVDPKGNTLTGAEFSIKDANNNDIWAKGDNGVYEYCPEGTEGAVKQFKTDDKGVLVIKGVAAGKYSVTEMVAPAGHNLLPGATEVEAKMAEKYSTKVTTYFDENGNVTNTVTESTKETETNVNVTGLVVVNQSGTELPSTGGIGTTIFYVLGGLMMVGAAVLLITKKRMSAKG